MLLLGECWQLLTAVRLAELRREAEREALARGAIAKVRD
jgi:hypothetical protein